MGWGAIGDAFNKAVDVVDDAVDSAADHTVDTFNKAMDAVDEAADTVGEFASDVGDAVSEASFSDIGHTALDVAGMVPVIGEAADLANAGWYLAEGDKTNAALSAAGAIPFAGNAATAAKWGAKAADVATTVAKQADAASDVAKVADGAGDAAKIADTAVDAASAGTTVTRSTDDVIAGSLKDVNPTGGTHNCVNCVVATDATLAGRPASALPGDVTPIAVLEDTYGGTFKAMDGGVDEIVDVMQDAGPGSRGIVFGVNDGDEYGHVFNVANQKGKVHFPDGQTGTAADTSQFSTFHFMRTN